MIYPTVWIESTNERHIVKDQNYCFCGEKYHFFYMVTRAELRKISFKPDHEVTCETCKRLSR